MMQNRWPGAADSDLSAAWERLREASTPPPREGDCPPTEALVRFVEGQAGGDAGELADHVIECDACRFEVEAATAWRRLEPNSDASPVAPARRWPVVAAAAAVFGALGLGALVWTGLIESTPSPPSDVVRAPATEAVSPATNAVLEEPPAGLAWPAQSGAESYRVRIYSPGSELLWESETVTAPEVSIPTGALRATGALAWEVEVAGPTARLLLGPYWFVIEAPETSGADPER